MAVFLCGVNTVGTLGLAAARHLASHGVSRSDYLGDYQLEASRVKCLVYLPESPIYPHTLESELRLYR